MMAESVTPVLHDTRWPLSCCPRCHKAELAGRARHRPVFRYDKVEAAEAVPCYRVFHGEHHVATLTRAPRSRAVCYEIVVEWESDPLTAGSLQEARQLAQQAYTAVWREGHYPARGPVNSLE